MIPKSAIEKAIEGGYPRNSELLDTYCTHGIALDPTFWQALAKVGLYTKSPRTVDPWKRTAREFYDLILTGGDTEKFWEEILK